MTKEGYQKVASKNDLKEGGILKVEPQGKPIILVMVGGKIYAMDAVCSHEGGPLEDGTLEGHELKCPWHYAVFDVRNAKVSDKTVWATDLKSYPVKVEDTGEIMVNLEAPAVKEEEKTIQQERAQQAPEQRQEPRQEEKRQSPEFSLSLLEKEKLEGTDIITFKLAKKDSKTLDYRAGQYAFFPLDGVENDQKGPVRHFTIASSPTEDEIIISTRIRDSPYKQRLASREKGTRVGMSRPQGDFVLHEDSSKLAVFLSGGIGVTPFRSMIKYATDKKLPTRIAMFDSNRNEQNILYKDEFDRWSHENPNLKVIYAVTGEGDETGESGWKGERGRIDKSMIDRHLSHDDLAKSVFYICGPPGMLKAMQQLLKDQLQISEDRIKVEEFTGY